MLTLIDRRIICAAEQMVISLRFFPRVAVRYARAISLVWRRRSFAFRTVLLALVFGGGLFLFFLRGRKYSKAKVAPGWNDPPMSSDQEGDLYHCLLKEHKEGLCPVRAFWWKGQHVVSICSPKSYKDTENLCNKPLNLFKKDRLHGMRAIQNVNDSVWFDRKSRLYRCIRGDNPESFYPVFVALSHEVVKRWATMEQIEVVSEMYKFFMKVIVTTLFGNIFEDDKGIEELVRLYCNCKLQEEAKYACDGDTWTSHADEQDLKALQDIMKKMLNSRRNSRSDLRLPLMDELLEADYDEDEIISHLIAFLGGYHTTTIYTAWLFHYLSTHSEVQVKLAAEIEKNISDDTRLKRYIQTSSSYLRQVLDEALRLSRTAPFIARYSPNDLVVDGYHIPANTPIIQAFGVTLHSSEVWDHPSQFDPDRFAPDGRHAKRGREFRPFGVVCTRRCPANHFVYHLESTLLSVLLHHHTVLPAGRCENIKKKTGITTIPAEALYVKIKQR